MGIPRSLPAVWCCLTALSVYADDPRAGVDFEQDIRPLLLSHCGECHGPETQTSDLRLDARHAAFKGGVSGKVIVPGDSAASELIRRVESVDDAEWMPPEGERLSAEQIALLKRWIDAGAKWPETDYDRRAREDPRRQHWAYQPLREIIPPPVSKTVGRNLIDAFIAQRQGEHGLTFSEPADRRTLIRRLSYDLLGLPPTPGEVERFVGDAAPDAYEKLVDRFLASPHYGPRWAQHWLDVVRYADTHGFEVNTPRENAWPYRDYVIHAFNDDKPYDQFVQEQLAGDAFGVDEATGFLVAAAVLLPGQIGKDEESIRLARQDALDEIIVGTGSTFLGLTIGCARCHDHKFDPIPQRDYYALQAFFAGVEYGDRPLRDDSQEQRHRQAEALAPRIEQLEAELSRLEPLAFPGRTLVIDDEDSRRVEFFAKEAGAGRNPEGDARGYRNDEGNQTRVGNLSGGSYTWWRHQPSQTVMAYRPQVSGSFRLWLSWGVHGSGVHTRDARYLLDRDGDVSTAEDRTQLAVVDQYYPAGVAEGETEQQPLWSGLLDVGVVELTQDSTFLLRGGDTGTGVTADVIVLQETAPASNESADSHLPRLRVPVNAERNVDRFAATTAKFVRFTSLETVDDNKHEPCLDELEVYGPADPARNLAAAEHGGIPDSSGDFADGADEQHRLAHINDGRYGNARSWISDERGRGWVQIELPELTTIDRVVWGRDREGDYEDRLPLRYRVAVSTNGQDWKTVATSDDRVPFESPYSPELNLLRNPSGRPHDITADDVLAVSEELGELERQRDRLLEPRMVFAGLFREPDNTHLLRRGDPEQPVESVGPAVPDVLGGLSLEQAAAEQDRRVKLARWLASPDNPLTARVMVNRIWQSHFGHGIVATPSDFGVNGSRPTHPDLLDWLAAEFIRSGWSIKHIQRLIVQSRTYRQQSAAPDDAVERDDRRLWRFPSRRLEAEAIRDAMLQVSGELNGKMGGPGFDFFKSRGGLSGFPPVEEFEADGLRRMVFAHKVRMESTPIFGAFDCPDAGQAAPTRSQSTTAIQALNLFNSQFVIERARRFASRVRTQEPTDATRQAELAFELALGRSPSDLERTAAVAAIQQHGLDTLCRVLFNTNEFLLLP